MAGDAGSGNGRVAKKTITTWEMVPEYDCACSFGVKIRRQAFCELLVRMRSARCEAWYTATETDKAQGRLRQLCYPGLRVHRVDVT
jgi:hypothetical protein